MAHIREVARKNGRVAFEVRWRENGVDRQTTLPTFRKAERYALKVETELDEGRTPERVRRETVAQIAEMVLALDEKKLKRKTLIGYRRFYNLHILPTFGKKRIGTVTSQQVEAWVEELSRSHSPRTVRNVHSALSRVFQYALRHDLITRNPCAETVLPTDRTGNQRASGLPPEQIDAIAGALDGVPPLGLLVRFTSQTGLRAAEVTGLRIRDVNLLKREIRVEQTIQRLDGEWIYGSTKTARGVRTVPLLRDSLVRELSAFLEEHPNRSDPDALLWPGRGQGGRYELDYGKPFNHSSFYKWYWRPALVRAGLLGGIRPTRRGTFIAVCDGHEPEYHTEEEAVRHIARHIKGGPRFHDLRHSAASTWLAAGIDMLKVSRWMGHSSIKITADVYGHLLPGDYSDAIAKLEAWHESREATAPVMPIRRKEVR